MIQLLYPSVLVFRANHNRAQSGILPTIYDMTTCCRLDIREKTDPKLIELQ